MCQKEIRNGKDRILKKKVALHNLGCKVNAYETEAMGQMFEKSGYEIVPFTEQADIYIINTCTVTNIADRKSRQMLHKAKKMNPDSTVVAVGCYAQAFSEELEKDELVDIIIGIVYVIAEMKLLSAAIISCKAIRPPADAKKLLSERRRRM